MSQNVVGMNDVRRPAFRLQSGCDITSKKFWNRVDSTITNRNFSNVLRRFYPKNRDALFVIPLQ